jgi:hypothetical protein
LRNRVKVARRDCAWHIVPRLNIASFVVGAIALILAIPTIIPLLGWVNWIILPIAIFGAVLGQFSDKNSGRNFCLVVIALCALRLWIGGGLI